MDLVSYIGRKVHITLTVEGFYYIGKVTSADEKSISLIDKNGKLVSLSRDVIATIREAA